MLEKEKTICSVNFNERPSYLWMDLEYKVNYDDWIYHHPELLKTVDEQNLLQVLHHLNSNLSRLEINGTSAFVQLSAHRTNSVGKVVKLSWRIYTNLWFTDMYIARKFVLDCFADDQNFNYVHANELMQIRWSDLIDLTIYPVETDVAPQLNRCFGQYKPGDRESKWILSATTLHPNSKIPPAWLFAIGWVNDQHTWKERVRMSVDSSQLRKVETKHISKKKSSKKQVKSSRQRRPSNQKQNEATMFSRFVLLRFAN